MNKNRYIHKSIVTDQVRKESRNTVINVHAFYSRSADTCVSTIALIVNFLSEWQVYVWNCGESMAQHIKVTQNLPRELLWNLRQLGRFVHSAL